MSSWVWAAGGRAVVSVCCLMIAAAAAGCGGAMPSDPAMSAGVTGNWEFSAIESSSTSGAGTVPLGVWLSTSGGSVTGSAAPQIAFPMVCVNGCCGGPFAQFNGSLAGSIDGSGKLKLSSAVPNGGPAFTMEGTVNGTSLTNGTFSLTGGCTARGTITGVEYPGLSGTYTGTMTSKDTGASFAISATLQQDMAVNSRGFLNVSGTSTLKGNSCLSSATAATPLEQNSGMLGNSFGVTMNAAPGSGITLSLQGTLSQDGKTLTASYTIGGGSCHLDYGTGTLTLQ